MPAPVSRTLSMVCGPALEPGCVSTNAGSSSTFPVSIGGLPHQLHVAPLRIVGRQAQEQELRAPGDDGQEVVEVVRDAAGELPHGFHLLNLAELSLALPERLFRALALADVEHGRLDGRLARPDDLGDLDLDPDLRAVAPG